MKLWIFIATLIPAMAMLGCQPKVGGRLFPVDLHSTPDHATAYVVPLDDWQSQLRAGGCCTQPHQECCHQALCADDRFLQKYRVRSGLTSNSDPLQVELRSHVHVYVAVSGDHREWTQFTPHRQREVRLMLPVANESE